MFGDKKNKLKDSERSLISETVSIEGTINSSGAIDIAGLVKGPVFSKEVIVRETGSITGSIEADRVEVYGHMDGKIAGEDVIIGSTGTVKGDIEFANNLRTENGADIDGYIKKTNSSKSKLADSFIFSKTKDEKKSKDDDKQENVVNKEALA
jgi:cytoskeletal protein CcmA (bactofilin family)